MSSAGRIRSGYTFQNMPRLVKGGKSYFDALEQMIDGARTSVQLQCYIFEEDHTGKRIGEKLIDAAERGVQVQILLDGYASRKLSKEFRSRLREAGVKLRFFEPIFRSSNFYFGRRLHHKIVVVDAVNCMVGGINISDRYNDAPGDPAWLDWAIQVQGEVAYELYKLCNLFYEKKKGDQVMVEKQLLTSVYNSSLHCPIRIRRNDWVMNMNQISASYMEMFKYAQSEIIIMSSYFIPSNFFRYSITKAIKRGVKIKVILAGISDIGIAKYAERYLYRWAIRIGIEIYEYKHNILHGKVAICDGRIVTIGSYNVNDISALASIELNLDVEDQSFAAQVQQTFTKIIETDCIQVEPITVTQVYSRAERLLHWISYETFRMIFHLFTFYFTRSKKTKRKI